MRKIPTLFERDPDDRKHVLPSVTAGCGWVIAGEGTPTRKWDGTCVMLNDRGWWARREVKPGKPEPAGFVVTEHDETTGKTVGWEPAHQSGFIGYLNEAIAYSEKVGHSPEPGTYELAGPRINGNPEALDNHMLLRHGNLTLHDGCPRDFDGLKAMMSGDFEGEGIVWHHPDGRMAKLKRRDFV